MILSLYLRWNQLNNRQSLVRRQPLLKSLITNEIKRLCPNVDHSERCYRGIAFRDDLMQGVAIKREEVMVKSNKRSYSIDNLEES
jgi:hypothetical protein